jgi:hypothetical protein
MILHGTCELKLSRDALMAIVQQHLNFSQNGTNPLRVTAMPGTYTSEFSFAVTTDALPPTNELNAIAATRPQPHIFDNESSN